MKNFTNVAGACVLGAVVLVLSGCNTERDPGAGERATLKAGQQVSAEMVGWVAVPNTQPQVLENKEGKYSYAVLSVNNVVAQAQDNWYAVPAVLFQKMTGIKPAAAKAAPEVQRWVLKPEGKSVPKEMNGWVAVPPSQVKVEGNKAKGLEIATLSAGNIVPKELNGWVAVNKDVFAGLLEKYMMKGAGADLPEPKVIK